MKVFFIINTEGQVNTWKHVVKTLSERGHTIIIRARKYGNTLELLNDEGLVFSSFASLCSKRFKALDLIGHAFYGVKARFKIKPDCVLGFGVDAVVIAELLGKPSIIFTDSEPVPFQNLINKLFSNVILTPSCFRKDFGKKQIRVAGYKELAYLHPNYFTPDSTIYNELGINRDEKFVILRFNAFDAVHDIGRHGFSTINQFRLVKELEKYARVFISPERALPKELDDYRLPIPYNRVHHALYYAQLLATDTGTMATEAAVLGTPSVMCLSNYREFGNFVELEQKYNLLYSFREPDKAIQKALELLQQPDLKEQWAKKRQKMLADKIDVTQFMVDFIENYPESMDRYKKGNMSQL